MAEKGRPVTRREFLRISAAGSAALAGLGGGAPALLAASDASVGLGRRWKAAEHPLRRAPEARPDELTLVAAEGAADLGGGVRARSLLLNESLPSPLLRVRRGERFRVTLRNELRDDLILHWHGFTPPEHSDGHPRYAVSSGRTYDYAFTVEERAGTYWYHSHAHMKTGKHTCLGIGGMIIVEDEEQEALGLPSGERDIPIIFQDRRLNDRGHPLYINPNLTAGYMGREPFGNGVHRPYLELDSALHRFRILNGSNARIFRLERSDGERLVVIGNDGGLLERPRAVDFADIAPGERLELLVDLRKAEVGERIMLRSRGFSMPIGLDVKEDAGLQGEAIELLELRIARKVSDSARIPDAFSPVPGPDPEEAVRERTFELSSDRELESRLVHMRHMINGRQFEMERVDERVPFGETEIWTFVNDNNFAHPMHLHGTHFRIVSRSGGRGRVMPWEGGVKDTVLLYPAETVRVAVRFTAHRGLFLLHCHNLEHEDAGMMSNVLVE